MIIKKYYGKNETEAIMLAKEDLGKDAIVTNIKKITPKGIFKFFRKPTVEITAAIDNVSVPSNNIYSGNSAIEDKIKNIQSLLEKQLEERDKEKAAKTQEQNSENKVKNKDRDNEEVYQREDNLVKEKIQEEEPFYKNHYAKLTYKQLIKNGVDERYSKQIMNEVQVGSELSLDQTLSAVYQKLVLKLGQPKEIVVEKDKCKFVFLLGPTGVGKTTTIAKIASQLSIYKGAKVALMTLDTYRIAAVEQLKTYANILDLPIKVIYSTDEFQKVKDDFASYDIVLVDTAGMSYRNKEKQDEVNNYINLINRDERDVYLVLSATTKHMDLVTIAKHYTELSEYSIIFTKLDETTNLGCILNLKMLTGADLSYVTTGQIVPDDISLINTQSIAKQLIGGIE